MRSSGGSTALGQAATMKQLAYGLDCMRLLLDRGADVNAVDHRGYTPLHGAAQFGNLEGLRLLLERGGDPNVAAEGEITPKMLAKMKGQDEFVALLDELMGSHKH